ILDVSLCLFYFIKQWLSKSLQNISKFVKNSIFRIIKPSIIKNEDNVLLKKLSLCVMPLI
ncbi:MAG: hypothetical protein ACK55Z_08400, partial [bacterium]